MEGEADRILAALREPRSYPRGADRVELIETHISRVFLAGEYAYKVKKSVALGFLDFSTLEARRFYCEEELRLNRRTAPDLYLAVVPITQGPGGVRVGGEGEPVEFALEMRRFPQEALADSLARRGELGSERIDAIAAAVAAFHGAIPAAPNGSGHGSPERVAAPALANFDQLDGLVFDGGGKEMLGELRAWTEREGGRLREVFAARRRDGSVRECHGDLHLGNIAFLADKPVLFDCIEFDPALRWIDVMNEAAFLVMDLLEHGLPAAAWRFLNAYLEATGDYAGVRVLRYYLVYRAMVRAKIAHIRESQPGSPEARGRAHREFGGYLALAAELAAAARPALLVMHGVSGSGKTAVAQDLLERLGAVRVRSDVERKRLHGLAAGARTHAQVQGGIYTAESTRLTYNRLAQSARGVLESGYPTIVDAAFLRRAERDSFRSLAREQGTPLLIVSCRAREGVLRDRVARRDAAKSDASEAGLSVLEGQLAGEEPLAGEELACAASIDTAQGAPALEEALAAVVNWNTTGQMRAVAHTQAWTRGEVWRRKLLYPGHTLPTAAAPVLVACGLALHDRAFSAGPALLALLAGWLIQLGGVLTDNYENLVAQPEDREHPELVEALRQGTLTLGQLKAAIAACYGIALLAGGVLLYLAGPFVLWIGLASIAASWAYSAGPWPIGKLGLADPLFFAFFGVVSVIGAYYVQAHSLPLSAFAFGLPVGALTTNILIIDDIRDRDFDVVKGKRTVAVRFGKQWSRVEFLLLLLFAYLAPLWFWLGLGLSAWVLLPWLTLPLAVGAARAVMTLDRYNELLPVTPRAGRLLLAYCVLLAIGSAVP